MVYRSAESLTESNVENVDQWSTDRSTVDTFKSNQPFKVGDRVFWDNCPGPCAWGNPFLIMAIEGNSARLDLIAIPVPLTDLRF